MPEPERVFSIVINAQPDAVWRALTHDTQAWYFGNTIHSSWIRGESVTYIGPDGETHIRGTVLAFEPSTLLAMTFRPVWRPDLEAEPETETEWRIFAMGPVTHVSLTHRGLDPDGPNAVELGEGWVFLLSNLKTLLETGLPLPRP